MIRWLMVLSLALFAGCTAGQQLELKKQQAGIWGLTRTITLYGADGQEVRRWQTKSAVSDKGGSCYFLDANGKAVTISGSFVIEEN